MQTHIKYTFPTWADITNSSSGSYRAALAVRDDAIERLAGNLADAANTIIGRVGVDLFDFNQRLNQVTLVGIPSGDS